MPSDDIIWEREGGSLPIEATINHGVLHIPNVTLADEGTYKCLAKQGELETVTEFRLQVDDFIPVFFGSDSIEFGPLEDGQIDNLDIQLTIKPADPNGVLFSTEKRGEVSPDRYVVTVDGDRRPPVNQHLARLQDGIVIYEYDVGHGRDELVLPIPLPMNEWSTVEVKNAPNQASVTVNGGVSVKKDHITPIPFPGRNKNLFIGRQTEEDQIRRPLPGLKGVVSEVVVSGENKPLARGNATPGIRPYDACKLNPCTNGGKCRKANRARGYTCVCEPPYGGIQCETFSSICRNENCNSGICLDKGDTWQCVCPVNATGIHCDKPVSPPLRKSFAFLNKTSFLAVQPPHSLEQMKVSLRLKPQQLEGNKILLYTALEHGPAPPAHISLSLKAGQLVYVQQNGAEKQELKSAEIAPQDISSGLDVMIMRNKHGISLVVNGKNASEKNTVSSFSPTTDLYIGGFPPAFKAADGVPLDSFNGCIEDVEINSKVLDLSTQPPPSSGDLVSCDDLPFLPDILTTTAEISTESPETKSTKEEPEVVVEVTTTTTTTTEKPEVIEFTPRDVNLVEIIRPTESTTTTTEELHDNDDTTTTEEPIVTMKESETTEYVEETTAPTTTMELPMTTIINTEATVITEDMRTTEEITTTETPENLYNTEKDESEITEPTNISGEIEPPDTQCEEEECILRTTSTTQTPNVCVNHDCGANGRCEPYNGTHYECVCNLFYDGPRCGVFKPIEHAAHFNGDAFIEISADEFPHLSSEKEESLSLRFKTTSPNGLLMWQGQQSGVPIVGEDYFSLAITNGYLHYSYELGGGAAHLVSPTRVTDGKEHAVRLVRRGRRGSMFLDDYSEIKGASSGILAMLNVDGNIFIGGVPDIETDTGGLHENNFVGCIADVRMNGEKLDLMGTAVDGKNVRPCEEWLEPKRWLRYLKKRRRTL